MSLVDHRFSQHNLDISPIWTAVIAKSENYNSIQCRLSGKIVLFVYWYHQENLSLESVINENVDTRILFVICTLIPEKVTSC
jgi:hypothetical protein